jgi:hypothetical protein
MACATRTDRGIGGGAFRRRRRGHLAWAALVGGAAICFGAGLFAGLFVPSAALAPDTVQSLADFGDAVRIRIGTPPVLLEQAGITAQFLESRLRTQLDEAGIRVVADDPEVPLLDFSTFAVSEPRVADAVAYLCIVQVEQPVRVKRLDRELQLPTFYYHTLGIEPPADLAGAARSIAGATIRAVLQHIDAARAAPRGTGR